MPATAHNLLRIRRMIGCPPQLAGIAWIVLPRRLSASCSCHAAARIRQGLRNKAASPRQKSKRRGEPGARRKASTVERQLAGEKLKESYHILFPHAAKTSPSPGVF